MEFPGMKDRFFSYVKIDTQSDEESESYPSTKKQFDLLNKLKDELNELGLDDVEQNKWGYVTATLKTNQKSDVPTIALIAHVDTSPDVSGKNVNPVVHKDYDGKDIVLSEKENVTLKVNENPMLNDKIGKTLITSDGTTLLGADNKAGITEIICAVKQGGSDPKSNNKLKAAIQKAKEYNFPSINVERNIKKAQSKDQQNYLELLALMVLI